MTSELAAAPQEDLVEVWYAARKLGYGQAHVRWLIKTGKLRAVRFGRRWRIDPRDLRAYIEKHRTPEIDRRQTSAVGLFPLAATP